MLTYLSILLSVLVAIKLMDLGLLSIYEDYEEVDSIFTQERKDKYIEMINKHLQ